jgi:FtsX-like permease family
MGAIGLIARAGLRRRWPSLIAVALLVALVSGAVLTALVGARRTSTSVDRFRDWAAASDASYQTADPTGAQVDELLEAVDGMPDVEVATSRFLVNGFPLDESIPDIAILTDPDGTYGVDIDRPRVLTGRLPDPGSPDEILLNGQAAELTGLAVGDRVRVRTWTTDDLLALFEEGEEGFPGFNGPELDLRVVGIGRTPEELPGEIRRGSLYALGSPALVPEHPDVGPWPPTLVVRLGDGAALDAVTARLGPLLAAERAVPVADEAGMLSVATTAAEVYVDTSQDTVDSLATGLLVLAMAIAAAGALAVGQGVRRHLVADSTLAGTLRSLGLSRSRRALAASLPIVLAGVVGTAAGVALAIALSPLLPVGLARRAETDPGVWIEPALLAAGAAAVVALLAAGAYSAALHAPDASVPASSAPGRRNRALARGVTRLVGSPTIAAGVRMASDRGRAPVSVPVRSALVGLTIGIGGVLAAGVIAVSLDDLSGDPERWGWTWSTMPDSLGDTAPVEELAADERVESAGVYQVSDVVLDGSPLTSVALVPLKGSLALTSRDGRLPTGPGEVAVGEQTLADLGVAIGGTVEATAPDGTGGRTLTVVGTAVLPPTEDAEIDAGAILTPDSLAEFDRGGLLESPVLRYPPGADAGAVEAGLAEDYGFQFGIYTRPQAPGAIRNLDEGRDLAIALAVFFAALGAVGLFHALLVSTRRRRGELAVLRALGLRRPQVRGAVLVQALALTAGGAVIGVPLGLVTGRLVWRALASGLGAVADPATPWTVMVVTPPIAAVVAALMAWAPGLAAVRARPADQLRVE